MNLEYFEFYQLPEVCRQRFFELLSPLNLRRLSFVDKYFNLNAKRQIKKCLEPLKVNSNVYLKIENDDITVVNDATIISLNCSRQNVKEILVQLEACFPCKLLRLQRTENDCCENGNLCERILNYYFFTFSKLNEIRFNFIWLQSETLLKTLTFASNLHTVNLKNLILDKSILFSEIISKLPKLRDLSLIDVSTIIYDSYSLWLLVEHSKMKSLLKSVKINPFIEIPNEDDFEALLRSVTREIEIFWIPTSDDENVNNYWPKDREDFCIDPFYKIILQRKK